MKLFRSLFRFIIYIVFNFKREGFFTPNLRVSPPPPDNYHFAKIVIDQINIMKSLTSKNV